MAEGEASSAQQKKRLVSPIIILVISLIFLVWMSALFMVPEIYEDFGFDISKQNWIYIGSFIMIILIIVLLVAAYPSRAPAPQAAAPAQFTSLSSAAPAPQPATVTGAEPAEMDVVEAEPLVVEAEIVEAEPIEEEEEAKGVPSPLKMKKPKLIEYPKKVPGGVYGDTIVRVDAVTKLNLRTLLIRSCMICDRQGKCWEEIQDTIPRDEFLQNIECKKGLCLMKAPKTALRPLKKKVMKMKVKQRPAEETVEVTEVEPE